MTQPIPVRDFKLLVASEEVARGLSFAEAVEQAKTLSLLRQTAAHVILVSPPYEFPFAHFYKGQHVSRAECQRLETV